MLLRFAWRNLGRNRRRTFITTSAMTAGVIALVFLNSYQESTFDEMTKLVTTSLTGSLQVHAKGYEANPRVTSVVEHPAAIESLLAKTLPDAKLSERVTGYGLVGSADDAVGAAIVGVDAADPQAAPLFASLAFGAGHLPVAAIVTKTLADELALERGSRLSLSRDTSPGTSTRCVVAGISDAPGEQVLLMLADAQKFFGLGDGVNQLLVDLPNGANDLAAPLAHARAALPSSLEVMTWDQLVPELKGMIDQKRQSRSGVSFVVVLIVALGVLNTMTMATFERTRELGVMASLGTRCARIVWLVVAEALLECLAGLGVGLVLSFVALRVVGTFDFGALGGSTIGGVPMPSSVALTLHAGAIVTAATTTVATALLGSLWPALRASRLSPSEATRSV